VTVNDQATYGKNFGFKGENIIKVGRDRYWGYGAEPPVQSELDWRKTLLKEFNALGGPQRTDLGPIRFLGVIRFVDIPYLSMRLFDLRNSQVGQNK